MINRVCKEFVQRILILREVDGDKVAQRELSNDAATTPQKEGIYVILCTKEVLLPATVKTE